VLGDTVGSYRIVEKLGGGGMGEVYLAEHTLIGRKVAVKLLLPELSHNGEIVTRFFNEARSTALIKHPGLVDIFDFGYHKNGSAYIVMECLEGESLGERLRGGPLPPEMIVAISRQIASALGAAHAKGIVHRDLKPDNVFLVPDSEISCGERVKVLDFGIAKLATETNSSDFKTRTGTVMGTPAYMSPEQCRGVGEVDYRADIYSLGCIMFEMACGRPPFAAKGFGEIIAAQIYQPPPTPRSLDPQISPRMEAMIMKALAKSPAERHQSMRELIAELDDNNHPSSRNPATTSAQVRTFSGVAPSSAVPEPLDATTSSGRVVPRTPNPTTLSGAVFQIEAAGPSTRIGNARLLTTAFVTLALFAFGAVYVARRGGGHSAAANPSSVAPAAAHPSTDPDVSPSPNAPTPSPSHPGARTTPPSPSPVAPAKVTLTIDSEPRGADLYRNVDMYRLGTTPYTNEVAPTPGASLVVLVRMPGFQDQRIEMPADRTNRKFVKLVRAARTRPGHDKANPATPHVTTPVKKGPKQTVIGDGVKNPFDE
jgi:serine/threonine-protein kinase